MPLMRRLDFDHWQNNFFALDTIDRRDAYLGPDDKPMFCYRGTNGVTCRMFARRPHGVAAKAPNGVTYVHVFCSDEHALAFKNYIEGKV